MSTIPTTTTDTVYYNGNSIPLIDTAMSPEPEPTPTPEPEPEELKLTGLTTIQENYALSPHQISLTQYAGGALDIQNKFGIVLYQKDDYLQFQVLLRPTYGWNEDFNTKFYQIINSPYSDTIILFIINTTKHDLIPFTGDNIGQTYRFFFPPEMYSLLPLTDQQILTLPRPTNQKHDYLIFHGNNSQSINLTQLVPNATVSNVNYISIAYNKVDKNWYFLIGNFGTPETPPYDNSTWYIKYSTQSTLTYNGLRIFLSTNGTTEEKELLATSANFNGTWVTILIFKEWLNWLNLDFTLPTN